MLVREGDKIASRILALQQAVESSDKDAVEKLLDGKLLLPNG